MRFRSTPKSVFGFTGTTLAIVIALSTPAAAQIGGGNNGGIGGNGSGMGGGRGNSGQNGTGGGTTGGTGGLGGEESGSFGQAIERNTPIEARGLDAMADPGAATLPGTTGGYGGFGGMGGMGGFGGMGGMGGLGGMFGGGMGQNQQTSPAIRTRLRSGVDIALPQGRAVGAVVNARLSSLPSNGRFGGVQVRMDGRTATLIGTVASEADRRMASLLIRLEPGVSQIEDQLQVAGQ